MTNLITNRDTIPILRPRSSNPSYGVRVHTSDLRPSVVHTTELAVSEAGVDNPAVAVSDDGVCIRCSARCDADADGAGGADTLGSCEGEEG